MSYDAIAATLFHSHKPPYNNLQVDVVHLGEDLYCLRFYQSNFADFSSSQQTIIAEWTKQVLEDMNKLPNIQMVWDIHE